MGSIRQVVLLPGLLKKPGMIASCLVKAERINKAQAEAWEYIRAEIAHAPDLIPDGDYELHFERLRVKVKKQGELWISPLQ